MHRRDVTLRHELDPVTVSAGIKLCLYGSFFHNPAFIQEQKGEETGKKRNTEEKQACTNQQEAGDKCTHASVSLPKLRHQRKYPAQGVVNRLGCLTDHRRCVSRGFSACVSLSRCANIPTELISVLVKQKGQ